MKQRIWSCPYCGFQVIETEYLSIIIDPPCRCHNKSFYHYRHFHRMPKKEEQVDEKNI